MAHEQPVILWSFVIGSIGNVETPVLLATMQIVGLFIPKFNY
jgi:hypothetical protein